MQKTYYPKPDDLERNWLLVDAEGQILGRVATKIAVLLLGKEKPIYTPGVDVGDFVVVINAEKIAVTGEKLDEKIYYRHSGYPGGLKEISLRRQLELHPERVLTAAVRGMIPRGKFGRKIMRKLKIYSGSNHPHEAQVPQPVELG